MRVKKFGKRKKAGVAVMGKVKDFWCCRCVKKKSSRPKRVPKSFLGTKQYKKNAAMLKIKGCNPSFICNSCQLGSSLVLNIPVRASQHQMLWNIFNTFQKWEKRMLLFFPLTVPVFVFLALAVQLATTRRRRKQSANDFINLKSF